jgi:hypothetical protein
VVQRRAQAGLATEPPQRLLGGGAGELLDGYLASEHLVLREEDTRHAAGPDTADSAVATREGQVLGFLRACHRTTSATHGASPNIKRGIRVAGENLLA